MRVADHVDVLAGMDVEADVLARLAEQRLPDVARDVTRADLQDPGIGELIEMVDELGKLIVKRVAVLAREQPGEALDGAQQGLPPDAFEQRAPPELTNELDGPKQAVAARHGGWFWSRCPELNRGPTVYET